MLKFGCTPYVSDSVVTPMIAKLQQIAPDVRIDLSHAYTAQLLRRLKRREVDLIIAPVDTMDITQGLTSRRLIAAKNLIACRKGHPLTRRRKLKPTALLDYRWIAPPADRPLAADMRNVMNRLAIRYGITALALNLSTPTRSVTMLINDDDARSYLLAELIKFLEVEFSALSVNN